MTSKNKIILPSVFTYTRSIEPGFCVFYAVNADGEKKPITVTTNKLRATFSGHKQASDGKKDSEALAQGNIHVVESAFIPVGCEKLQLEFSFKVVSNSRTPGASNNSETKQVFEDFYNNYIQADGHQYIAKEYIKSLLSGNFLWRNKNLLEDIKIEIVADNNTYLFDVINNDKAMAEQKKKIEELSQYFARGLTEKNNVSTFRVKAYGTTTEGQQVFPSQVFTENKSDSDPSRVLATTKVKNEDAVIFTSEKLGNALRRIDTWYEDDAKYPLPVEPLGIDREFNVARRHKDKKDFYTICKNNLSTLIQELSEGTLSPDSHYMFACLVRGGVYNGAAKK